MYLLITILIFLAAIILVLVVLVQNSKGGGLASGFSATNQVMGVRKTTDFLEKATWTLAGAIAILSIVSAGFVSNADTGTVKESIIKDEVENAVNVDPNISSPKFDAQQEAPAQEQAATQAPAQEQTPAQAPAAK